MNRPEKTALFASIGEALMNGVTTVAPGDPSPVIGWEAHDTVDRRELEQVLNSTLDLAEGSKAKRWQR